MDHRVQLHQDNDHPDSILVFSRGEFEHLLAAVPAFWAVRRHFPTSRLTLLCDETPNSASPAVELFADLDLFDAFESYPVQQTIFGRLLRAKSRTRFAELRNAHYDTLVYLMPSDRPSAEIWHDRNFFTELGIKNSIGMDYPDPPEKIHPLPWVMHETDALLARLSEAGIPIPHPGQAQFELGLGWNEEVEVDRWLQLQPPDSERPWVAVCPSARTPAKRWTKVRWKATVATLISKFNVWPILFGAAEDQVNGESLIQTWQCGYNAAGYLKLRPTARALSRCRFYMGPENFVMHLAAAVGIPCVAVSSACDYPGRWYPYGYGHAVLRSEESCAGCGLSECVKRENACLRNIETRDVISACAQFLEQEVWAAA